MKCKAEVSQSGCGPIDSVDRTWSQSTRLFMCRSNLITFLLLSGLLISAIGQTASAPNGKLNRERGL